MWHLAQAGGCQGFSGCDTPVVLANGTTVYRTQYSVEVGGRLVGVVAHLQVAAAARGKTGGSPTEGSIEREGTLRSITRQLDATLFTSWSDLTDSERTVAELVGEGLSNKQTGRRLFMSPHTVDYHLRRIYQKLGIRSRVELARLLGEWKESLAGPLPQHRIA